MTNSKDELEKLADMYADNVRRDLIELYDAVSAAMEPDDASYRMFLRIEQHVENVRRNMNLRDAMGNHSATGGVKYRHIAHPDKNPPPPVEVEEENTAAV